MPLICPHLSRSQKPTLQGLMRDRDPAAAAGTDPCRDSRWSQDTLILSPKLTTYDFTFNS